MHKYTSIQANKYTITQVQKFTTTQVHKYTSTFYGRCWYAHGSTNKPNNDRRAPESLIPGSASGFQAPTVNKAPATQTYQQQQVLDGMVQRSHQIMKDMMLQMTQEIMKMMNQFTQQMVMTRFQVRAQMFPRIVFLSTLVTCT